MGLFSKDYDAVQVDESLQQQIEESRPNAVGVQVRPFPDNDSSFSGSQELFKTLYKTLDTKFFDFLNVSDVNTFEIWYDDGQVKFYYFIKDEDTRKRFLKQLGAFFPNAEVQAVEEHFPAIHPGDWIAGGRFHLNKHYFEPVRTPLGTRKMDFDPYKSITNDMTAKADTRMVIQVALRPTASDWSSTWTKDVGEHGEQLKNKEKVTVLEGLHWKEEHVSPPTHLTQAAKDIIEQKGRPAFFVNLRMLAIGPTEEAAINQCKSVGSIYQQTHEEVTKQTLVPRPQTRDDLPELLDDMTLRRGRNMNFPRNPLSVTARKANRFLRGTCETIIMTMPEVTALAHIPDKSIENTQVDWYTLTLDGDRPSDAPEFEDYHDESAVSGSEPEPAIPAAAVPTGSGAADGDDVGEFESEWEQTEDDEIDDLLEESMDDPMDDYM